MLEVTKFRNEYIRYLTESKGELFVPKVIPSQSAIVFVKMDSIDWLEKISGK